MKVFRWLAVAGLVGYGLFTAYGNWAFTAQLVDSPASTGDFVTRWEERLQRLKEELPAEVTMVGYVADWDLPGVVTDPIDQDTEYVLTQYTLAPIAVVPGLEPEWIIGNFVTPDFQPWLDGELTSYEITAFGYGIYLIQRTTP